MPAPVVTDVVTVNMGEDSGTEQVIALSLDGNTPTAVVFLAYRTTVDDDESGSGDSDEPADHAVVSWGCTDGTSQWLEAMSSETGQSARSDTYQWLRSDAVVQVTNPADGTVEALAVFNSWSADEVVIDWTTSPASPWKLVVFAMGGDGTRAEAGTASSNGTADMSVSVSHSLNEAPSGMVFGGNGRTVNNSAAVNDGRFSIGYASYDGSTIRQCSQGHAWYDNDPGAHIAGRISDVYVVTLSRFQAAPLTDPAKPQLEVTAVSASAVTVTTRVVSASMDFGYLFIAGPECFAGIWTFPSGTGTKTFSMPAGPDDLYPKGVLFTHSRIQTAEINASQTNVRAGTFGWSAVGTSGVEGSGNITMQRETVPTNTSTFYDDTAFHNHPHTGANPGNEAAWASYETDGWSMLVSEPAANDVLFPMLLIGVFRVEPDGASADATPGQPSLLMTQTVAPDGVGVGVGLGQPSLALLLAPDGTSADATPGEPSLALRLSPDGLGVSVGVGQPSLILRLLPDGLGVGLGVGSPSLALVIGPTGLAVEVAFGQPVFVVRVQASPAGTVVQSGLVAGTVSRSGMNVGTVTQSGVVAGAATASGQVAGTLGASGLVAGTVSQSGMVAGTVVVS